MTAPPSASPWRRLAASRVAPLALLAVFAALVIVTIDRFSTWMDESGSLLLVGPNGYAEIVRRTAYDAHPPLWYWVLKPWLGLFGATILAARAQSAVFMLAALAVWYHFVRIRLSRSLAVLTLALTVTNPMLLHYGVEARMYAFSILLVGVSCVLITGSWRWRWFAYWPCAVAMLYTHYFLAFAIAGQFVYLMLRRRELGLSLRWIMLYGASIIAGFGPWIPYAARQTSAVVADGFWVPRVAPNSVLDYVLNAFLHRGGADLQNAYVFPALFYLGIWWAALVRAARERDRAGVRLLLWCLVIVPMACLFVLSCKPFRPMFHARYVVFGLPALITLLSAGALAFTTRWRSIAIAGLLLGQLAGQQMLRYRGFSDARGYWAMKDIAAEISQPIDGELPWVAATWSFCFADARATLDDHQRVVIVVKTDSELNNNNFIYYGRPDWSIASLSEVRARHVWLIGRAGVPPIEVPPGWTLVTSHQRGYASARLFATGAPSPR